MKIVRQTGIACIAAVALGCTGHASIEAAARSELRLPSAAQIRVVVVGASGDRACVTWTEADAHGAPKWQAAALEWNRVRWSVKPHRIERESCSPQLYELRDDLATTAATVPKAVPEFSYLARTVVANAPDVQYTTERGYELHKALLEYLATVPIEELARY